jgi:AcrR family transcriptional regulator
MEAIARRADVSRLTIYYQFKSRPGLLEALYDYLAMRGNMRRMAQVFQETDPLLALGRLVQTFVGFWASDPVVIRRLRAISALDTEIGSGIQARDALRYRASEEIVNRMAARNKLDSGQQKLAVNVLCTLTSFETYDALARAHHTRDQIVSTITSLARYAITKRDS